MTEEAKESRREYWRQYYATHKEQHKETMERYWEKRATGVAPPPKVKVNGIKYDAEYLQTAFRILCSVFNDKSNSDTALKGAYEGMRLISNYIRTGENE